MPLMLVYREMVRIPDLMIPRMTGWRHQPSPPHEAPCRVGCRYDVLVRRHVRYLLNHTMYRRMVGCQGWSRCWSPPDHHQITDTPDPRIHALDQDGVTNHPHPMMYHVG